MRAGSSSRTTERYGEETLARVIWLTVGTSAVISRESPTPNAKLCGPIATCLLPCSTRQTRGLEIACTRPLGEVARTVASPGMGVCARPVASA